jgi:transposase
MSMSKRAEQAAADNARRRRRLWSEDEKRAIVAETLAPGASVSVVAQRHDVNANLLFTWRRQIGAAAAAALAPAGDAVTFMPAVIGGEPAPATPPASAVGGWMEIVLADGHRIITDKDVDAAALGRVVKVLSRR